MSVNDGIMFMMAVGALLGGADCILHNRFGLGEKFEEGFLSLGPIALSMVGMICLSPKLAECLGPLVLPLFRLIGGDPAMFGSVLAIDMGGFPLALALANNLQVGYFSGILVASMFGATIVFTIPVGFGIIREEDRAYFAKGLLIGLIPIPVGAFIGGIMMGLPSVLVFVNLIPVIVTGLLLVLGLLFMQERMVISFIVFGKGIRTLTLLGLTAAAFEYLTGWALIPGMFPIMDSMKTVAGICIVLLGSLPLITLFQRALKKPFEAAGRRLGLDAVSIGGIFFSCVSILPVLPIMKDMTPRGKVTVTAFMVSAMAVFAAHFGFTAEAAPSLLVPMITSKLISGICAAALALVVMRKPEAVKDDV